MNHKNLFIKKINEVIKLANSLKIHYSYVLLTHIINLCDEEKFNNMIDIYIYNNTHSSTLNECFYDLHKALRQVDMFQNGDIDMLLYNHICLFDEFYLILSLVTKQKFNENV